MSQPLLAYYSSPIGVLRIVGDECSITGVEFTEMADPPNTHLPEALEPCVQQLQEYFDGRRTRFELRLAPEGTPFQRSVWRELANIPYGRMVTYRDIARALGNEKAVRAVGAANGRNPIPIIIPCHRVIGSSGHLVGFGGGLWRKAFLLRHEQAVLV